METCLGSLCGFGSYVGSRSRGCSRRGVGRGSWGRRGSRYRVEKGRRLIDRGGREEWCRMGLRGLCTHLCERTRGHQRRMKG